MRSVNDAAEIPLPLRLRNSRRGCKYISFVGKRHACVPKEIDSERGQPSSEFSTFLRKQREKVGLWGAKRKLYLFRRFLNPMLLLFNAQRVLLHYY